MFEFNFDCAPQVEVNPSFIFVVVICGTLIFLSSLQSKLYLTERNGVTSKVSTRGPGSRQESVNGYPLQLTPPR